MKIDRHNYEEYFILYMDNELATGDRMLVEAFVQNHPDLKEELDLLLQYKMVPDTDIVFNGKEELTKVNGETPLSLSNYEEWLTLYIDNELTAEQKRTIDQFVAVNPLAKEEFTLLQLTKLQPEQIVFANKESLYKREEKDRSLYFRWWRVAAALLVLAIGLTTVIVLNNKPSGNKGSELVTVPVQKIPGSNNNKQGVQSNNNQTVATGNEKNSPVINPVITKNSNQAIAPAVKQVNNNNVAVNQKNDLKKDQLPKNELPHTIKNETVIAANTDKTTNNLPQPINNPNITKNDAVANITVPKEIINPKKGLTNDAAVTNTTTSPSNIVTASYPEDNANLNQPSDKKTKLRGFFRKVTRTFEKRTNTDVTDDDNKLLVAGLAFKLK
ncbi:MAG: hypothetical protein ABJA85_03425 [Bacteroidota bacterium]